MCKLMLKNKIKLKNILSPWKKFQKLKHGAFNKAVENGKKIQINKDRGLHLFRIMGQRGQVDLTVMVGNSK